jgi:simple sugar transport system permease protein
MTQVVDQETAVDAGTGAAPDAAPAPWKARRREALELAFGLGIALLAVTAVLLALGHAPFSVYESVIDGALGTEFARGQTVTVMAPLLLTGLAAVVPFSARQWNVGGEGQMAVGGVASVLVALHLGEHISNQLLLVLAVVAGALAGLVWGVIPGFLKTKFGANEVIVCLMLNFIALLMVSTVVSGQWKSYSAQTVAIPENARLAELTALPGANWGIAIALAAVVCAAALMMRGVLGFKIRAVGMNERTSRLMGIKVSRVAVLAFALGGVFAGLAGAIEVTGKSYALVQGFTANIGFLGIAIALVARRNAIAVVPTAAVFAIVSVGGDNLKATQGIDPSLSTVLIALFGIVLLATQMVKFRESR